MGRGVGVSRAHCAGGRGGGGNVLREEGWCAWGLQVPGEGRSKSCAARSCATLYIC